MISSLVALSSEPRYDVFEKAYVTVLGDLGLEPDVLRLSNDRRERAEAIADRGAQVTLTHWHRDAGLLEPDAHYTTFDHHIDAYPSDLNTYDNGSFLLERDRCNGDRCRRKGCEERSSEPRQSPAPKA